MDPFSSLGFYSLEGEKLKIIIGRRNILDILLMNLKGTCSPRIVYKGTRGNCSQPFRIRFPNFSLCIKTPAAVVLNHLGFDFLVSVCFNFSSKFKLNRNAK